MNLENTVSVYGHVFTLNVAVKDGLDWTGKAPKFVHYCLIQLGDDKIQAWCKAERIKQLMGDDYKFTFCATPKVGSYSEDI